MIPHIPTEAGHEFSWRPYVKAAAIVALLALAWLTVIGPGIEAAETEATRARIKTCRVASSAEEARVASGLRGGSERFVRWVAREDPNGVFVSAEYREPGLAKGADGEVATWRLTPAGGAPESAEPVARERSSFAPGDRSLTREQALLDSRFCVVKARKNKWQTELSKETP